MPESLQKAVSVSCMPRSAAIIILCCLASIGIVACSRSEHGSAAIQFELSSDDPTAQAVEVRLLRFYVHDIELLEADGTSHRFEIAQRSPWQDGEVALLDLSETEPDGGNRVVEGSPARNARELIGVRFTVGVPFARNHANPLQAAAPLDRGDMFWSWQTGYKFMRVDLAEAGRDWSFHLGSTGCVSASAVRAPASECAQPNLVRVELRGFDPSREPIRVRLDELVRSMRATPSGVCTGAYGHEPACEDVFGKTGLDVVSGRCPTGTCVAQRLFGVATSSGT